MSPDTEEFSEALENLSELSLEDTTFYLCFISTCAVVLIAQYITVAPCSKCSGAILAAFIWEQQKIPLEVAEDWGKCVPSSARTYTYVICSAGLGRLRWSAPDNWLLGGSFSSLGKPSCRGLDYSKCSRCTQMQPQQDEHILLCFPMHFKEKYSFKYLWLFQLKKGTRYPPGIHLLNKLSSLQKGKKVADLR